MAASLISKTLKTHRPFFFSQFPRIQASSSLPSPLSTATTTTTSSSSSSSSESQENERGIWSKSLLFLPGAITFGLGTWQIFRRQEKIEMLEYRRKRLEMDPIEWNKVSSNSLQGELGSLEFRKVLCDGVFDEGKSVFVGPRSRTISGVTENGYYVVTPLVPASSEDGSVQLPVLVNRGWVPRSWRDRAVDGSQDYKVSNNVKTSSMENVDGSPWWKFWGRKNSALKDKEPRFQLTRVIGVIRGSEKPSIFVPANDPNSGQWFYVDVPMIARACDLPENTVYIEDINEDVNPSHPYPVPKDINTLIRHSVMPQDHLNYTITWYSLSAAVTFMALKRIRPKAVRR